MTSNPPVPPGVDVTTPSIARVYDYLLGGKDNFAVDRELGDRFLELDPEARGPSLSNRHWLRRVVRWLATSAGIDQFLDVGSGLPTVENTHEVAQQVNPDAVVVYVDNDPAVIAHGRALLDDNQRSFFVAGDLTRPEEILTNPDVIAHLDLDRPVALLQCLTLHFVADQAEAEAIVSGYADRLAAGSYVGITHAGRPEPGTPDADAYLEMFQRYKKAVTATATLRTEAELAAIFGDLDLVDPGIVPVPLWWPAGPVPENLGITRYYLSGVARKR